MRKEQSKKPGPKGRSKSAVEAYTSGFSFQSDPSGSYTGRPKKNGEKPEQDADDL